MKKLFFYIFLFLTGIGLSAQDITISFQPEIAGTHIDSIWVTNQTTNQKVKLLGNESLILTKTTGIDFVSSFSEGEYLYPNPCYGDATIAFSTYRNQNVELRVYNISGQLLSLRRQDLVPGLHRFQIQFPAIGLYSISIIKNDRSLSFKVVCIGVKMQECNIDYEGSETGKQFKNAEVGKTLSYTQGDILHYSVFSGKNNTILTDSPTATKVYNVDFYECIDNDKISYPVVKIGSQWWMARNLAYLPKVSPPTNGSDTAKLYYVYGYNGTDVNAAKATANYTTYGVLYNWPAAMAGSASSDKNPSGVRGICPQNWHLPSDAEWFQLKNYLIANGYNYDGTTSGNKIAKSLAATTNWASSSYSGAIGNNLATNNKSGFSGLPGGGRSYGAGFYDFGYHGGWWSSTEVLTALAWYRGLDYDYPYVWIDMSNEVYGNSVRCVRDF